MKMSAIEISRLIIERKISVHEVVSSHIEQAQLVNGNINAIVGQRYEEALEQAKKLDRSGAVKHDKPLFGVPFTVKESIAVHGLPNTYGSYSRRNDIADKHATTVERLLKAGAILIGQTNLSELALWPECDNVIYGKTSNPHNIQYTSGGSSGGDAAIVSAGGVPFALGTDGGGSIRIPAAHCGVFGHKPSSKFVPMTGHFPLDRYFGQRPSAQFISRFFAMGPICRKAEDLLPLLKVISGPDNIDKNITRNFNEHQYIDSLKGLKIYLPQGRLYPFLKPVEKNITRHINFIASVLEKEGAEIIPIKLPFLSDACDLWFDIISTAKDITLNSVVNLNHSLLSEAFHRASGKKNIMLSTWFLLFMEKIAISNRKNYLHFLYCKNKISAQLNQHLDHKSVLLLATYPSTAIKHSRSFFSPFDFLYSAIFNVLELPATSVPVSMSKDNLPVSIQLAAAHGCDHIPITLACYLEKTLEVGNHLI
ncbi:amidase [Erwinia sp. AnSW2-5]|uniref:amidase n=1 Tax=Erwinia sp. AnSW2-5 TaxID=3367692 RepID=UPI00385849EC